MYSKATLTLLFAALAAAGPISRREVASLDPAATAEAHQRDATATRAFSNVQIKTSDGKCLSVDPLSGDFRANLTPIQITDCGSAQGQGWDVITSGVHNDQKGEALIVSTLTQACFNFDPRRAAGNQVLLFSCGGRADGGGSVTNSQLFAFTGGNGPLSLTPENDATKCLVPKGNLVDIADCSASDATQKFTIGGSAGDSGSSSNNTASAAATSAVATSAAAGSTAAETQASATSASATSAAVTSVAAVTDAADAAAATTLTVLATSVHTVISCAPTVTNCPARSNQTAIASLPESAKTTVVVTDTVVLATTICPVAQASSISSSLQAAHSSGLITGSTITATTPAQAAASTTAAAAATTSGAASAATGAAPGGDENAQCSAPKIVTVSEVVTVTAGQESASATAAAVTSAGVANNAGVGSSQTTAAAVSQPAITGNPTTPVPVSGAGGTLNPTAAAEANPFDTTAERPVQSVNVRAADGRCLSVNPTAGDFRENLIPIAMVACNQEDQSQKFDIVTKGIHNDGTAGEALIVSVLTNGCVNFDPRRAANDQVIMFACGGRADGSGKTTTSQLFPFKNGDTNIILTPASATNQTCLIAGADRVEAANCDNQKDQVFQLAEIV
ncbi:hypothetical protein TGAMA5MH_08226 [Trichoderma gamsii]|uniref:Ricin B lectin domain-containing protein n=1 Tax=Trichoderma gamsii TaxID=398673 RepID=A0A2K0T357_9HYPO|nr:hypothetical protein TGAMA5MH_08226 [Trichoderma gamsii]